MAGLVHAASTIGYPIQVQDESQPFTARDLVDSADRYCVAPDGDHTFTWALAAHNGLTKLSPDDFPDLRLPATGQLGGYETRLDGKEFRVLTARNRFRGWGAGLTPFHLCWVSANPMTRGAVERELQRETGFRGFRQEGARVFAWIPQPDGSRREVRLREWQRRGHSIAREEGMRMILVNDYNDMTAITYMTPLESCEDWC